MKHSSTLGVNKTSCMELDKIADKKKGQGLKKQATLIAYESEPLAENLSSNSHYLFLPEYRSEKIYSELLTKIIGYEANLRLMIGPWREHAGFLEKFAIQIHLFHLPEVHDLFAPILFNLIQNGNATLHSAVSKCIVEILIH